MERFSQTPYEIALYETPVWKRVDQLERSDVVLAIGIDDNDQNYDEYRVVEMARPYFAVDSDNPNHAWVQGYTNKYGWERQSIGHIYDLTLDQANNYMYPRALAYDVENPAMLLGKDADGTLHYQPYRTTVYNIEVEDTHTYLVGHAGILMHNTCGQTRSNRMAEIQTRSKDSINRDVADILRREGEHALKGKVYLSDESQNMSVAIHRASDGGEYYVGKDGRRIDMDVFNYRADKSSGRGQDDYRTAQPKGYGSLWFRLDDTVHLLSYTLPYPNPFI